MNSILSGSQRSSLTSPGLQKVESLRAPKSRMAAAPPPERILLPAGQPLELSHDETLDDLDDVLGNRLSGGQGAAYVVV
jgi:hypothetical protein